MFIVLTPRHRLCEDVMAHTCKNYYERKKISYHRFPTCRTTIFSLNWRSINLNIVFLINFFFISHILISLFWTTCLSNNKNDKFLHRLDRLEDLLFEYLVDWRARPTNLYMIDRLLHFPHAYQDINQLKCSLDKCSFIQFIALLGIRNYSIVKFNIFTRCYNIA